MLCISARGALGSWTRSIIHLFAGRFILLAGLACELPNHQWYSTWSGHQTLKFPLDSLDRKYIVSVQGNGGSAVDSTLTATAPVFRVDSPQPIGRHLFFLLVHSKLQRSTPTASQNLVDGRQPRMQSIKPCQQQASQQSAVIHCDQSASSYWPLAWPWRTGGQAGRRAALDLVMDLHQSLHTL